MFPKPEVMMRTQSPSRHRAAANDRRIPITPSAFRWLELEVDRLSAYLDCESATAWMKNLSGDADAPTFMGNGELDVLARRLDKLRTAVAGSHVMESDGSAMVGTSVTVQAEDGSRESYLLVAPGASDARCASISSESPVGSSLMWKRSGDVVLVETPTGTLRLHVVSVEEP
jgi:hypothetical protein